MLHHGLRNSHSINGISSLICGKADYPLNSCINRRMKDIIRTDHIGAHCLHGEKLTGRNLLQGRCMENIVHTGHSVPDGLSIPYISYVKFHFLRIFRILGLKFMTHVILFLLITGENTDLLEIRIEKVFQNCGTKRTCSTGNHKCFFCKS